MNKQSQKSLKKLPSLVVSDENGNIFDVPHLAMLARQGNDFIVPPADSLIPLPVGSDLHMLPARFPVGADRKTGEKVVLKSYAGMKVYAASAFLAPAYTALYLSAFEKETKTGPLPLFAYTALGFQNDRFVVSAMRVDSDERQDCQNFNQDEVIIRGKKLLKKFGGNRLTTHLINNCAFTYLCPAARNWVMGRWEAPVPVSVGCNSECVGCISKQPEESEIPATQERLTFIPKADEIVEYAVPHLENAPGAIVSFGQGCEGEPLTQAALVEESVREIRKRTKRGTVNLNTNASLPDEVERICKAGLNSIRVSLNSVQKPYYDAYFHPKAYSLDDVFESMRVAKSFGVWVSINYFIFPGFTDRADELNALKGLLNKIPVDMIQMRNLNMDPDLYCRAIDVGADKEKVYGIKGWMEEIKRTMPDIVLGYYNPCV